MIYVVFWYLLLVSVFSTVYHFYKTVVAKATNGEKVGALIGVTFKFTVFMYFFYTVYPLLSLVK
jgi:hypothetical protein